MATTTDTVMNEDDRAPIALPGIESAPAVEIKSAVEGTTSEPADSVNEESPEVESLFEANRDASCRVGKVMLTGIERTKSYILARELEPVRQAKTLDEVLEALTDAHQALDALDIFEAVEIKIDKGDKPGTCNVVVNCAEKGRFSFQGGSYVQGSEGSVEVKAGVRNVLGYAERVNLAAERGSKGSNEYSATISKPRWGGQALTVEARVAQLQRDFQRHSSFTEQLRQAAVTVNTDDGMHTVMYELCWRELNDPSRSASNMVRREAGHSIKSSVTHTFRWSNFADPALPIQGTGFRCTSEVAGLGPDSTLRFLKQHLHVFYTQPIIDSVAFSIGAEAGVMVPWGSAWSEGKTAISDRFFLGGVGSLRGFRTRSVGPVDTRRPHIGANGTPPPSADVPSQSPEGEQPGANGSPAVRPALKQDFLGGNVVASVMAALTFELPNDTLRAAGLRGQVFINGGNTMEINAIGRPYETLSNFGRQFRWSAGVGLLWPTGFGDLEVNFCRILRSQPTDRIKRGVQVGFAPKAW